MIMVILCSANGGDEDGSDDDIRCYIESIFHSDCGIKNLNTYIFTY